MKLKKQLIRSKQKKITNFRNPGDMEAAIRYHQQGELAHAERIYRALLARGMVAPDVLNNLALICNATGRFNESQNFFEKACALSPGDSLLLNNLASVQMRLGLFENAAECLAKSIAAQPRLPGPYITLGNLHRKQGRFAEALLAYEQAYSLAPHDPGILNNFGMLYRAKGELGKAEDWFKKALSLRPDAAKTLSNLGLVYLEQGQTAAAIACYDKAITLLPNWDPAWSNKLMALNYQVLPKAAVADAHRLWGKRHTKLLAAKETSRIEKSLNRPIRIGYVSGDFRRHSVACFIEPILTHHDCEQFDVYCYANVSRPDEVTARLKSLAIWRDIFTLSDDEAARLVQTDKIDILIDLSGHTEGNRLLLFARKPAPVQATYLGYPTTTGLNAIDYRLTDTLADPPGEEKYYTENLVRLPRGFLCFKPAAAPDIMPQTCSREKKHGIVFGSFNNLAKLSSETIRCWAAILNRVPESRLLLKYKPLSDELVQERIREEFRMAGLAEPEKRLDLLGHLADTTAHFSLYNQIDIALDTFPYNGTTTTCEALWMGIPVITLAGDRHACRVGASILQSMDRGEWIAIDDEQYVTKAVALAQNHPQSAIYRRSLRNSMLASPLMDAHTFCRELEKVCRSWLE